MNAMYRGQSQIVFTLLVFIVTGAAMLPVCAPAASATWETITIATSAKTGPPERLAADELAKYLGVMFPNTRFAVAPAMPATGAAIVVGSVASDPSLRELATGADFSMAERFVVRKTNRDGRELGVIAGVDARGTLFGVYSLLEKLGCGFSLSGDVLPAPRNDLFSFDGWEISDAPLVRERLVFNWHNFLSGCSTWNLADWQRWTAQSQKMGYNAIMVHAYGNNPMAGFTFEGKPKPVGYLSTTIKGRDWSTMHVNDAQRLFGGEVFDQPAFGADAGLVSEDQRVAAAQSLMRDVFADAERRGMGVWFDVDVDTPSANPQELVMLLPESARFEIGGSTSASAGKSPPRIWLPNPDTPEGYAFFRAEVAGLMKTYPQITKLVVWFRRGETPWMNMKTNDLPAAWQKEFAAETAKTPEAEKYWHAPGLFAIGKIVRAFERALKECGAEKTGLAAGTWGFEFLNAADRFFPAGVPLIGLDYDVIHEKPQLGTAESRAPLREIGAHRPVIPIVWAHHDDGHYIGRPYTPLPEFASKLEDAKAAGFGIIHWTTRPLDLYFSSLAKQTWKSTKDQSLRETCREIASRWFGGQNRETMGGYLEAWVTDAPRFARETSDHFIDRKLTNIAEVVAGCRQRLAMIGKADVSKATPEQRARLDYYRGLEEFIAAFFETHGMFQESQELLKKGDLAGARKLMERCRPEPVIEQFAKFGSIGGMTRGEQGLVVSMNTRWLSHIIRHRQSLGLDPVRINFAPTSHDMLAQSRGTFTFHFGTDHDVWECWGEEETGAHVFALPASVTPAVDSSAPAVWREIGRTGVESDGSLSFAMRPIMAKDSRGKSKTATLPPGEYRLRLLLLDPTSTAASQRVFSMTIDGRTVTDQLDIFKEASGANRILERSFSVTAGTNGLVSVTLAPVTGKVIVCGAVLEPVQLRLAE